MDSVNQKGVVAFAMEFGMILGIYYILKFFVGVISLDFFLLNYVNVVLTLGIPFVLWKLVTTYRDRYLTGGITFNTAFSLGVLVIFFASLPEVLTQYLYIEFFDVTFLERQAQNSIKMMEELIEQQPNQTLSLMVDTVKSAEVLTPVQLISQTLWMNIYSGALVSIVVALIARQKK